MVDLTRDEHGRNRARLLERRGQVLQRVGRPSPPAASVSAVLARLPLGMSPPAPPSGERCSVADVMVIPSSNAVPGDCLPRAPRAGDVRTPVTDPPAAARSAAAREPLNLRLLRLWAEPVVLSDIGDHPTRQ